MSVNLTTWTVPHFGADIDLSRFPNLHVLRLAICTAPGIDLTLLNVFRALVRTWAPPPQDCQLELAPLAPDPVSKLPIHVWSRTRERFIALLSHIGRIAEDILAKTAARVVVHVKDHKAHRHWWAQQVAGCFPVLDRSSRVSLRFIGQGELGT